ncbi:MAG TPA: hypothetical protein VK635_15655 [Bradyrhizobium sp.]|jgi:hypothetical protein|nr:hypothetical protein [Bradyrhizobium sp.]
MVASQAALIGQPASLRPQLSSPAPGIIAAPLASYMRSAEYFGLHLTSKAGAWIQKGRVDFHIILTCAILAMLWLLYKSQQKNNQAKSGYGSYARHFLQSLRSVQKRPWCPFGTIRKSTRPGNSAGQSNSGLIIVPDLLRRAIAN